MRPLLYFFFISIFVICSCNLHDSKISIVGKWYKLSLKTGYSEFEIDSQYVVVFSQRSGYSKLKYKIENDSFKYTTINYSAKIVPQGDTMINLTSSYENVTLIRYNESIHAFESVPDKSDSLKYNLYQEKFYKRADSIWNKAFGVATGK
jgi:hypothetical protein